MKYTLYGMAQRAKPQRDLSSGWLSYEVFERNNEGEHVFTPFSDALAAPGVIAKQAITKMRMVQNIGWPEAKRNMKDDYGHPLIVKKDDVVWLLKCKPSCWRLYFYVTAKKIIYLLAICKKTDSEDPGDALEARRAYNRIGPTGSAITAIEFPTNRVV